LPPIFTTNSRNPLKNTSKRHGFPSTGHVQKKYTSPKISRPKP
jgi:hypothetical protein